MLDRLEAEILLLREKASAPLSKRAERKTRKKRPAKQRKSSEEKTAIAEPAGTMAEPAPRVTGKRQALGRSLLQLRKMTSRAAGLSSAEEDRGNSAESSVGSSA